jgi:hypothetical protein
MKEVKYRHVIMLFVNKTIEVMNYDSAVRFELNGSLASIIDLKCVLRVH